MAVTEVPSYQSLCLNNCLSLPLSFHCPPSPQSFILLAAAQVDFWKCKSDCITPLLKTFPWLSIRLKIQTLHHGPWGSIPLYTHPLFCTHLPAHSASLSMFPHSLSPLQTNQPFSPLSLITWPPVSGTGFLLMGSSHCLDHCPNITSSEASPITLRKHFTPNTWICFLNSTSCSERVMYVLVY